MAETGRARIPEEGIERSLAAMGGAWWERLKAMPVGRRRWLGAGLLLLLGVGSGLAWVAARPDWRVLFSGLEAKDVQTVEQELAAAGIAYEPTPDQTGVQVAADQLDKARMTVAAKGMPQTGRMGFELFDKPNWVGSEFDEHVNYQRALEGELEHTIAMIGDVRSARVHLVLPQQSLFLAEEKPAKASVVMKLKRSAMSPEQADAVRNLVASAVEGLTPGQVTLVDADGRTDLERGSRAGSAELAAEQEIEARLVAMLEPLAGAGNVRATVNLSYVTASTEHLDEVYDPTKAAQLSTNHKELMNAAPATRPSGVPGAASNSPAASPVGAVQGTSAAAAPGVPPLLAPKSDLPVYPSSNAVGQNSKEENDTFAVTKHTVHSEEGPGRIRRVTAAIVVNDRMGVEGTGATAHAVWHARTADELHRLEGLAQAAVGFDPQRGDQVVLENVSFTSNVAEPKASGFAGFTEEAKGMLQQQPGLLRTVTLGLLGAAVVLLVVRPVATQVVASLREPALLAQPSGDDAFVAAAERSLPAPRTETRNDSDVGDEAERGVRKEATAKRLASRPVSSSAVLEQIAENIRREPAQSTRLLEAWITAGTDGEVR